ncbi:VOC family protein [Chitinophaga qingshengii]|uniref:VOC family protein n=1 Tax=Chitinophaga qingshengii TaxID=1569794 RepID=A0ABR7TFN9_9BACT|nr:VOC family protein [Chitinophaga qingshengii]MBC9929134.1 VOC family protein [Chitinophaga qingshengii]
MNAKKIWANFGVADLDRTTKFYQQLGFKHNGAKEQLTSFFFGDDNFIIHFFLKDALEAGVHGSIIEAKEANEIVFTLSADSRQEVDEWAIAVKQAGGTLVTQPEEFGPGFYGFVFTDPDGHKFNIFLM